MFSVKSLAVFFLLGPLIGAFSVGMLSAKGASGLLLFAYLYGGFVAIITWVSYSTVFSLLHEASFKSEIIEKIFFESYPFISSSLIAAVAGYLTVTFFICTVGTSNIGGLPKCATLVAQDMWEITFLPGAICGFIATIFLAEKRYIRH